MRIAAFQRHAIFDDAGKIGAAIASDVAWADDNDVDIAIFPEAYLQGHSYNAETIHRRAMAVDDPRLQAMLGGVTSMKTAAIIGFFERRGQAVYNSAMLVERGRILGVYDKVNPLENGCTPGQNFPVWQRAGWTFGINICSDLRLPEISAALAAQGAGLICCPLNMMLRPEKALRFREPALQALQACAQANGAWVVSSDVVGSSADGKFSYGCTAVVRPDGTVAAQAAEGGETALLFDLPPHGKLRDGVPQVPNAEALID